MALVIWRVVGNDVVGYLWAFFIFVTIFPVLIWSMRKFMDQKYITKECVDVNGKVTSREWGIRKGSGEDVMLHYVFVALLVIFCSLIAFA